MELMPFFVPARNLDRDEDYDFESHEEVQAGTLLTYTLKLSLARMNSPSLERKIGEEVGPLVEGKDVLEVGPGVQDALLLYVRKEGIMPDSWDALDINPRVVQNLMYAGELLERFDLMRDYNPVHGSMSRIPAEDKSYDTVCGLCSLDSIIDFDGVAEEFYRVIRPGGRLIHVQDHAPSYRTLIELMDDERVGMFDDDSPLIVAVQSRDGEILPSHHYMHKALSEKFCEKGFVEERLELVPYENDPDHNLTYYELFLNAIGNGKGIADFSVLEMSKPEDGYFCR